MTTVQAQLNQVDLPAVGALVQAVADDPTKGHTTWSSTVHWLGAFRSEAKVRDLAPVPSDEPSGLGGTDTAPNPVEQLLGALGNCLAVGYAANATVAGIEIKDLSITVSGDVDLHSFLGLKPGHAGFRSIRAVVDLKSDADAVAVKALHERVAASSPVGHTLSAPVDLSIVEA